MPLTYDFSRCTLLLMVGIPYSGKTTQARKFSRALNAPIVSPDAIRVGLSGERYQQPLEPTVWWVARMMARALFLAGHRTVIIDATNTTKDRREEWRGPEEWEVRCYEVEPEFGEDHVETCKMRAQEAGDVEILPVIERMADQYEPVDAMLETPATNEGLLELWQESIE